MGTAGKGSMSYTVDFHASSPSAWRVSGKAGTTKDISGRNFRAWSRKLDLVRSWLKTSLASSNLPLMTLLGFWTKDDILSYLRDFSVPYCGVYGDIAEENGKLHTTGERAAGCMFGVHRDGTDSKFTRMKQSHQKSWEYCVYTLGLKDVLEYIGVPYGGESDYMEAR